MPVREKIRKKCLLEFLSTFYHLLTHTSHMLHPHKKVNRILLDPHSQQERPFKIWIRQEEE
jgi:hypothetical protein